MGSDGRTVPADLRAALLASLKARFERHPCRHEGLTWAEVQARLEASPSKLWSLSRMEESGGEPDVVGRDGQTGGFVFFDCAAESPGGRRSLCYDRGAWASRKEHRPEGNAVDMASEMGTELLTEEQYRALQELGEFDTRTSSWLRTPPDIRGLNGAIFADRRYGRVFVYHNSAPSYSGSRGFRACLRV